MESKKPVVLVALDTVEELYAMLEEHFEIIRPPKGRDFTKAELIERIGSVDALCSVFDIPIDKEIIDAGKKLRIIANYAVGFNNIDIEHARQKGIAVTNTPRAVVAPTAELALALMLAATRRVAEWDRLLRKEQSSLKPSRLDRLGVDLYGKTLGIAGFGNIGRAVAQRAQAFGMRILYYKRHRLDIAEENALGVTYMPADELFSASDIVSLHMPYNMDSHHFVDAARLALMKPNALLINTARGAVVDEDALVTALTEKRIACAALDVFEDADRPDARLYELDNVVMTPHVGTQTYDARVSMARELCNALEGYFFRNGEGVPFVVRA